MVTTAGFVFTDPAGVVLGVVDGEVSDLGRVDATSPHLVADDDDSRAGWFDPTGSPAAFVVHDLASGETVRNQDATEGLDPGPNQDGAVHFYAIDDATAYWRDSRGLVAVDLTSGDAEVIEVALGRHRGAPRRRPLVHPGCRRADRLRHHDRPAGLLRA